MKNFVIVKHPNDFGKYLFFVPRQEDMRAGDEVLVETKRGPDQHATCVCDSFFARPEVICPLFNVTPENMKWITGRLIKQHFQIEAEE